MGTTPADQLRSGRGTPRTSCRARGPALQDDLLGGLRGDAAEVVRRDVVLVDLVAGSGELRRVDLPSLRVADLLRLGSIVVSSSIVSTIRCASRRSGMIVLITGTRRVHRVDSTRAYLAERLLLVGVEECPIQGDRSLLGVDALLDAPARGSLEEIRRRSTPRTRIDRLHPRRRSRLIVGEHDLFLGGPDQLVGEADDRPPMRCPVRPALPPARSERSPSANGACAPWSASDKAAEVRRLVSGRSLPGEAPQRSARAARSACAHTLAQRQRDALRMVNEHAQPPAADHLGEQHLDLRLAWARSLSMSVCSAVIVRSPSTSVRKKAGGRPLSVPLPAPACQHESCRPSIASARRRIRVRRTRRRDARVRDTADSRHARAATSRPAPAADRPRGGARATASSGPDRTASSRWWASWR